MSRWKYLLLAGILVFASGCSTDPRKQLITATINNMSDASAQLGTIAEKLNQASAKAQKDNPNGAMTALDLKEAFNAVESLKQDGKELAKIKGQVETLLPIPQEERDDLAKEFQGKITAAIEDLEKNKKLVNEAILKAEPSSREAVKELREKLREAEGEYEALTRNS